MASWFERIRLSPHTLPVSEREVNEVKDFYRQEYAEDFF
jgi:hypothetical protein